MAKKIICKLPIVNEIEIFIKNEKLYEFAIRQLKNYIVSVKDCNNHIDFIKFNIPKINKKFNDVIFGREVIFKDNKVSFSRNSRMQNIDYIYDFNDGLKIDIKFRKKPLYLIKQFTHSDYSLNHILFYETILYPIFSLYAVIGNYSLVHGGMLKLDDKYIVLTGLDGVGKSSLSNELVLQGAKVLADNFLLFNGEKFITLNMPLRLDLDNKTQENIIYKDNNLKEILYDYCERKKVKSNNIYFLTIGEKLSLKEIDSNIFEQNWNLINNGAGEILSANLFNLPFLYQHMISSNINNIKYKSYIFSIPKGKIKEATEELMCQLDI